MKLLAVARQEAMKDGVVKYPLDCGCSSAKFYALCDAHKLEVITDERRTKGVPDIIFRHRDFTDLRQLSEALHIIKLQLISNPTKSLLIKINPETLV
jgi:hypothetical protein